MDLTNEEILAMAEPFKIKVVELISDRLVSRKEREKRIKEAGYNIWGLKTDEVYIDLKTDSGVSAMSDLQWSAMMIGDETYAGARSFYRMEKAAQEMLGFKYIIPCHQGRTAESLLFPVLVKKGDIVPCNMIFDSTEENLKASGGKAEHCVLDVAYEAQTVHPFKGNVDLDKLKSIINEVGIERIPLIMLTIPNQSGGGQPASMANIKAVREIAIEYHIPVYIDAARCVENAYFIQQREDGYQNKTIAEIYKEQFSYSDGCVFSCKKDPLLSIGGLIALNDKEVYYKILPSLVRQEGYMTYGGLAGRDMEAMAVGLREMVDDAYMASRIRQVEYLGKRLEDMGIQIVKPIGGHAIFVDAAAFLPHIPLDQFPANALAVELYIECGVKSGKSTHPTLELLRLAIPRRVYTDRHMDVVAEGLRRVYERRDKVKGLKIVWVPSEAPEAVARFFARFERV